MDQDGNKIVQNKTKVDFNEKDYLSQTIKANKIYNINKVITKSNANGEINTLLINLPNKIFGNNHKKSDSQPNKSSNITNVNININIQQLEIKENPLDGLICDRINSKKGDINFLKKQRNEKLNLNIKDIKEIKELYKEDENLIDKNNNNYNNNLNIEKASPSKNWRKLSNIFRSLNSLKRYDTKYLENNNDLDSELQDFRERLNTFRNKKSTLFSEDCEQQREYGQIRYMSVEEREIYRISVKERILQVILELV